jgi:hypothetical protein
MNIKTKIYLALAAAVFLIIAGYSLWSNYQIRKLETCGGECKQNAQAQEPCERA